VTAFDQSGVDWLAEDGLLDVRPCAPNIADHVILYSAFASQPPVVEAHIKVDWMSDSVPVENHDGITVGDVMDKIREWSVDSHSVFPPQTISKPALQALTTGQVQAASDGQSAVTCPRTNAGLARSRGRRHDSPRWA
jgi:hypothetical protein